MLPSGVGGSGGAKRKESNSSSRETGGGGVTGGALSPQRHLLCQKCTSIISALCAERKQRKGTERAGGERGEKSKSKRGVARKGWSVGGGENMSRVRA